MRMSVSVADIYNLAQTVARKCAEKAADVFNAHAQLYLVCDSYFDSLDHRLRQQVMRSLITTSLNEADKYLPLIMALLGTPVELDAPLVNELAMHVTTRKFEEREKGELESILSVFMSFTSDTIANFCLIDFPFIEFLRNAEFYDFNKETPKTLFSLALLITLNRKCQGVIPKALQGGYRNLSMIDVEGKIYLLPSHNPSVINHNKQAKARIKQLQSGMMQGYQPTQFDDKGKQEMGAPVSQQVPVGREKGVGASVPAIMEMRPMGQSDLLSGESFDVLWDEIEIVDRLPTQERLDRLLWPIDMARERAGLDESLAEMDRLSEKRLNPANSPRQANSMQVLLERIIREKIPNILNIECGVTAFSVTVETTNNAAIKESLVEYQIKDADEKSAPNSEFTILTYSGDNIQRLMEQFFIKPVLEYFRNFTLDVQLGDEGVIELRFMD